MPKNLFDHFSQDVPLSEAISERYLQYALSTIMHRALPDARDGLKPVQRRILYAMQELKLSSTSGFRKSAKISGDVMGNYHPHGEQAIYDALARMAQDFNLRYPLVDGQGNFGNIDGDKPASSRYTEARLTTFAESMLEGLNEDSVDFRPNYDDTLEEPVLLPSSFPNLLANGSTGIAVGMAANIPPHNIIELCNTCIHLIRYPDPPIKTRMSKLPGPDFPTGGIIVSTRDQIEKAYVVGKGQIRVRARWEVEQLDRNQWQIVVTEIPYQVQKSKLIEGLAKLVQNKKTQLLADVRDESTEIIRIVLEPKTRKIEPETLMEAIFKLTEMETRFSMNLNVLIDGQRPKVCDPWEILRAFLNHRIVILKRRTLFRINKIDHRLTLLEGYLVAFLNLDRVIEIIRYEDKPKETLINEFELHEVQAEAILNMRLRSLRKLEEIELQNEQTRLTKERCDLDDLLNSDELQKNKIIAELKQIKDIFAKNPACKRRTGFSDMSDAIDFELEDAIESEPVTVICSQLGWIRLYRGHVPFDQDFKFRDGDSLKFALHGQSTDKLVIFGSNGRFYSLAASSIPGGRGLGEPIRLMLDLPNETEIQALLFHNPERQLVVTSETGYGFIVDEAEVLASTKVGKQVLNLKKDDIGKSCVPCEGDHLALVGANRKMLVIPLSEIPVQAKGTGVRLQKFQKSHLSDIKTFTLEEGLFWKDSKGKTRQAKEIEKWLDKRGKVGLKAPYGFPAKNVFS
ncbi:MAG: DNA topoisomerase IV subunit A [Rhodobacteraceae bacterium]|nr:DNA topoisomerase IV subunit A [Paracoccaceae bacterium]MCY4249981.1 DNA topoisomerase IV subunit A [Paracoccaceae bacterium]MCY4307844.1 DNA topoisomerase IV subunit A [Paracoccaceae bacterium]